MNILFRKILPLAIITGLCVLSLWVRFPNMDRALGDHHEWVTQHTLIVMKNWESQGALNHRFCLLMTFKGKNNRGVFDYFGRLMNKQGYGYYASFPPGAVVYPYLAIKALGLKVTPLHLQIFNVICHFFTAFILYWLLLNLLRSTYYLKEGLALIGVFFFLFLPNLLWFFSNVYSWDTFWCYPLIAVIGLTLKLKQLFDENKPHTLFLILYGLALSIMIYSDYYGLIYTIAMIPFTIVMALRNKAYIKLLTATVIASLLPVALIILQYSSINGIRSLIAYLTATTKGYTFKGTSDLQALIHHAKSGYNLIFIPIITAAAYLMFQEKGRLFKKFSSDDRTALYLSFVPAVLFLTIQSRWSAEHDYSMLRLAPFLIIMLTILLSKIRLPLYWSGYILLGIVLWKLLTSCLFYYKANFTFSPDPSFFKRQGTFMRENSQKDEVLFAISHIEGTVDPRFTYYIRRNVQNVFDNQMALAWLLVYEKQKGVLFNLYPRQEVTELERFDIQNLDETLARNKIKNIRIKKGQFNKIGSAELFFEDGVKRELWFKNGSVIHDTYYDHGEHKSGETVIDYWSQIGDHYEYDEENHIKNQQIVQ